MYLDLDLDLHMLKKTMNKKSAARNFLHVDYRTLLLAALSVDLDLPP